jgi:16S rRNA G527 N7-methylase RsmG
MRKVVQDMGLKNIVIEHARLETCARAGEEREDPDQPVLPPCDGFTSRATLTLAPTLEMAAEFVAPGGHAFLWKGSRRTEEMARPDAWHSRWTFVREIELKSSQSVVVEFLKEG